MASTIGVEIGQMAALLLMSIASSMLTDFVPRLRDPRPAHAVLLVAGALDAGVLAVTGLDEQPAPAQAAGVVSVRQPTTGAARARRSWDRSAWCSAPCRYALTGLLVCGHCQRRLPPHWVHGRPAYRCRHGHTSAQRQGAGARWIYWPEHRVLREAADQLVRDGRLPANTDAEQALAYLRTRNAVIICDAATVTIDDQAAIAAPATVPCETRRQPIPQQRNIRNDTRDSRHLETRRQLSYAANREPHRSQHAKRE